MNNTIKQPWGHTLAGNNKGMIKALSVRQPWAWMIIHAGKDIENRTWPTKFRGRFLVHASKKMTQDEYKLACYFASYMRDPYGSRIEVPSMDQLQYGGFIGSVEITGCTSMKKSRWFEGPVGFELANPEPMEFVPYTGTRFFFDVPVDALKGVA